MSSNNFQNTREKHPELAAVAQVVESYLESHERKRFIDILTLSRELDGISAIALVKFLAAIEECGEAQVSFRVVSPANGLVDEEFDSIDEVPDSLVDNLGQPFEVEQHNIVPVYQVR